MWVLLSCAFAHQRTIHIQTIACWLWLHVLIFLTQQESSWVALSGTDWSLADLPIPLITLPMLAVYAQKIVSQNNWSMSGAIAFRLDLSCNSKPQRDVSYSRAVFRYVQHPRMFCSFQIICVKVHKMMHCKQTAMHVLSRKLPIIAHMLLETS